MGGNHKKSLAIFAIAPILLSACGGPQVDERKSITRYDLALDYLKNGDFDAAEAEAKKSIEFNPNNSLAYNALGLSHLGRAISNVTLLEISDCLTGIDAEGLRREVDDHLAKADLAFSGAVERDSEFGEAMANRGVVALNLEDYPAAVRHFDAALQFPNRLSSASLTRANLGWAHFHAGDAVAAAKELRQSLQFQPGMCLASYRLGRVYFERKEWDKALEKFREVASPKAQCPIQEAHLYLAKTYQQLGRHDEIAGAVDSCVKLADKSCIAVQCRALAAGQASVVR